jgi:hypothetical protein
VWASSHCAAARCIQQKPIVLLCSFASAAAAATGKAYRATVWASSAQVEKAGKAALLRNFISKQNTDGSAEVDIDPRWYQVRAATATAPSAALSALRIPAMDQAQVSVLSTPGASLKYLCDLNNLGSCVWQQCNT